MKNFRIILYVLGFLYFGYRLWSGIADGSETSNLLVAALGLIVFAFGCLSEFLNWKETRPTLDRVINGSILVIVGIIFAILYWRDYKESGDAITLALTMIPFLLFIIFYAIGAFLNWEEKYPKLYEYAKIAFIVLFMIVFLVMGYFAAAEM